MLYRKVSVVVGALALGLYLTGSGIQAQENRTNQRPGSPPSGASATANQGHHWEGRIGNVDATKRQITLNHVKRSQGVGGSKTGSGTTGSGTTTPGTTGSGTTTGSRTGTGSGTAADNKGKDMMTFMVSATATITLDGKTATLSELKSGQYARVSSKQAGSRTGSGTTGSGTTGSGTTGSGTSGSGTTGSGSRTGTGSGATAGAQHTVDRIEAFTKEPASTGTGRGTGTGANPIK